MQVLRQLDQLPADEAAAAAIRSLLGETEATTSAEEIAWAFRKTLEKAASERPVVVVIDDLHRGEETFLDLIEHVALLSSGASILLLCLARPELLDRRSAWPITLRLEPLGDEAVAELIPRGVPGDLRERIARAAGGNPLFIEEMLAIAGESDGDVVVPPTLQTLLAARLDQLEAAERTVLERGAVEGEIFHRGAVQALTPDDTQVTPRLAALVRKELIRPAEPQLAGEDGFRFRHLLIRDAAYEALPKAARAELHERFAAWLEEHGADLVELDEILGYHLEQACLYRAELGTPDDGSLAAAARRRLGAAGGRAGVRGDNFAAANLLHRAAALVPPGEVDVAVENDLVDALFWSGKGEEALRRANLLAERASAAGDRVGELCGKIMEARIRFSLEPEGAADHLAELVEDALPVFEAARDDRALFIAYSGLGQVEVMRAQMDAWRDADEQAFVHAQRAGLTHHLETGRAMARYFGTTPVSELLAWLDEEEARGVPAHFFRRNRALCLAMLGRIDRARELLAEVSDELRDRGGGMAVATTMGQDQVVVELLAGDFAAAAEHGEESCRLFDELGEKAVLSTAAGRLAQALYALDRLDEADEWAGRASELGASDDAATQMLWRQARAKVLARRGNEEAEPLAREAVAIGEETDMLDAQGDAYAGSRRGAAARRQAGRGRRRARAGPGALRAQGEPRLEPADAHAPRRDPGRSAGAAGVVEMQFDTKIGVVLRDDLAVWQKTNVTAFLVSGIAGTVPGVVGEPYRDASGNEYLPMFVQPVLVYEADAAGLRRAYERAMSRGVTPAVYTHELFATSHDEANRAAVADVDRAGPRPGRNCLPRRAQDGRQDRRPAVVSSLIEDVKRRVAVDQTRRARLIALADSSRVIGWTSHSRSSLRSCSRSGSCCRRRPPPSSRPRRSGQGSWSGWLGSQSGCSGLPLRGSASSPRRSRSASDGWWSCSRSWLPPSCSHCRSAT